MENQAAQVGVNGIRQIAINVKDVERAKAFYRDVIGLTFLFDAPKLAFFDAGGVRLMLGTPEKPEFDHPASIMYYSVTDIKASHDAIASKGAHVERGPELVAQMPDFDLWISFYKDSEGNYFGLMSEVRR
jgi:methylmalonyl-CoA/ethylmalonyl-CoA epimerase